MSIEPKLTVPRISAELQALQRQRAIVIKSRIMQENRLQAIVAGTLGYYSGMPPKDRLAKFREASALIATVNEGASTHPLANVIRVTQVGIDAFDESQGAIEKSMKRLAHHLPVRSWVEAPEQRGFGLLFLAIVIGETGDLADYPNPAKLWRRLSCAPWSFDGQTHMGSTWRKNKLPAEEWIKYGYNPRRRSIAYLIGDGLVKQNGVGPYRQRYDEAKAKCAADHPDYSKDRCHKHGMLLATKRLLRELWAEWHRLAQDPM